MSKTKTLIVFRKLLESKESDSVWNFFEWDFSAFSEEEKIQMQIELFDADWHRAHEEFARVFQIQKHPLTIDMLYKNAFREELDIFEYKPLARRCTWALADIGTPKAKAYLEKMAVCNDALIAGFAQKRLDNWEKELSRKT